MYQFANFGELSNNSPPVRCGVVWIYVDPSGVQRWVITNKNVLKRLADHVLPRYGWVVIWGRGVFRIIGCLSIWPLVWATMIVATIYAGTWQLIHRSLLEDLVRQTVQFQHQINTRYQAQKQSIEKKRDLNLSQHMTLIRDINQLGIDTDLIETQNGRAVIQKRLKQADVRDWVGRFKSLPQSLRLVGMDVTPVNRYETHLVVRLVTKI